MSTAVATVVMAVVTTVYAFFTWRLWQETRRQAIQTREIFETTHRPWLSIKPVQKFGFSDSGVRLHFCLHNYGTAPAFVTAWGLRWGLHPNDTETRPSTTPVNWVIVPGGEEDGRPLELLYDAAKGAWSPGVHFEVSIRYRGGWPREYYARMLGILKVEGTQTFSIDDVRHDAD